MRTAPVDVMLAQLAYMLEDARLIALHVTTPAQREAAIKKAQEHLEKIRGAL